MTANPDVVSALEGALVEARSGRLLAVGIIKVHGPQQVSVAMAGPPISEVYLGGALLQGLVMQSMQQKPSPIVRPGLMNGIGQ